MSVRHVRAILGLATVALVSALAFRASAADAASAAPALPYYDDVSLTPHWPASTAERASMHRVGDFNLVDANGRLVTRHDVEGRIYVASFFYTECRTLCPDLRAQLARVRDAFAADTMVRILSHSVMPERDDAARLAHYAVRNGVDGRQWKLLAGSRAELTRLAHDAYFVELADSSGNTRGTLRHTETLVLVDRDGHIRGVYDGSLAYDVTQLIADIKRLSSQALLAVPVALQRQLLYRGFRGNDADTAPSFLLFYPRVSARFRVIRDQAVAVFQVQAPHAYPVLTASMTA